MKLSIFNKGPPELEVQNGAFQYQWTNNIRETIQIIGELIAADDPLQEILERAGRDAMARILSSFGFSQGAGILGFVCSTINPALTIPLLLKKINSDLTAINKKLDQTLDKERAAAMKFFDSAMNNFKLGRYEEVC